MNWEGTGTHWEGTGPYWDELGDPCAFPPPSNALLTDPKLAHTGLYRSKLGAHLVRGLDVDLDLLPRQRLQGAPSSHNAPRAPLTLPPTATNPPKIRFFHPKSPPSLPAHLGRGEKSHALPKIRAFRPKKTLTLMSIVAAAAPSEPPSGSGSGVSAHCALGAKTQNGGRSASGFSANQSAAPAFCPQ